MLMLMRHIKSGEWTKESTIWVVLFYMGKLITFFPPFFFLIHLHEFMRKVFVYREKRVRVTGLVAYCNYFKKIIFYCVKITQESHNFSLKLACIVCVRNIPLYVISITLLYSNEW